VAIPVMIAGAAISAMGTYSSYESQKASAQYGATVARNNALVADQYAAMEGTKGVAEEETSRLKTSEQVGATKVAGAAAGVDVTSGTPLETQADVRAMGDLDALTIRSNAARNIYGYRVQGVSYQAQAALDESRRKNLGTAEGFGVASSIMGGASSVSDKWRNYQMSGVDPWS
jgi:hypothetical protein